MPPRVIQSIEELHSLAGQELGVSDWLEVTQARIDAFAEATGDRQWIHCDPDRARRESPYGATIAHGFLTLSLCASLAEQVFFVAGAKRTINYGLNRLRFPHAVPSGSRIRLVVKLLDVRPVAEAQELTCQCTVELEGQPKPACVAEWVLRIYV
jgi:acyl dehydratase